ncbi:MAG: UvrD-helicase domain-containing protein [Candidatus Nanopelagicales bacterium]
MISLDEEQLRVANHLDGALVVIATAGSGKTTAISHRIATMIQKGVKTAEQGLALTFTNKSALELKHRLQLLSISTLATGTFHAIALRQLSYFWPQVFGGAIWPIQSRTTLLSTLTSKHSVAERRYIETEIDWLKSSGLDAVSYQKLQRVGEVSSNDVAEIYGRYQDLSHSKRVIDFDDVLQLTIGMLSNHPEILKDVRKRYTWFTVDEFQDVTPTQNTLLRLWVGERDDICVVGDPAQTIYSFAGARAEFLKDFWIKDAEELKLTRTYRCPENVTQVAQSLMATSSTPVTMESVHQSPGLLTTLSVPNESEEAKLIGLQIKELLDSGIEPQQIAILIRLSSMSQLFESALEAESIPFRMKGMRPFFERSEIKEVLLALRQDYEATSHNIKQLITETVTKRGWSNDSHALSEAGRQVWDSVTGLLNLADQLGDDVTLGEFFHHIGLLAQQNLAPTESLVTISTLHSAKGLEWEYVFIPSVVEGVIPYANEVQDEERRLLFVGITRSKYSVTLSVPKERFGHEVTPSRFLLEMKQQPTKTLSQKESNVMKTEVEDKQVIRCRICQKGLSTATENTLRRCESCEGQVDEKLLEKLFLWRRDFASATGQVDWLILSDVSLQAVSELQPASLEELQLIHGFSSANLDAFGEEILRIINSRD